MAYMTKEEIETLLALYSEEKFNLKTHKNGKTGDRVIYRTTKSGKGNDYTYSFNKLGTIIDVLDVYDETCHPYKVQWDREPGYKEQEIQYCKESTLVHINRDQKLTIGKTVGLISNVYGDTHNDPIFGGRFGWVQGTIKYYAKEENSYGINWDNHDKDHLCWYQAYELVVIERCPNPGKELYEKLNNNNKPLMSSIKDQIKNIERTEPEKTFVEIGFMDDNGDITQDGREALELIQWKNSQNQLKEMADKLIAARNPETKKRTTK